MGLLLTGGNFAFKNALGLVKEKRFVSLKL